MERELSELIEPLPLSEDMRHGLLQHEGALGEALKCALAFEVSHFDEAVFRHLTADDITIANIEAISWANMVVESL